MNPHTHLQISAKQEVFSQRGEVAQALQYCVHVACVAQVVQARSNLRLVPCEVRADFTFRTLFRRVQEKEQQQGAPAAGSRGEEGP